MKDIDVKLNCESYRIIFRKGFSGLSTELNTLLLSKNINLITNTKVHKLYAKQLTCALKNSEFNVNIIVLPDSETSKSLKQAEFVYTNIAKAYPSSKSCIVALGGGVVGDISGFIASTYKRGIDFIQIPTTLLAQVDASIGGKTAVDLPLAKNMVGTFYQPKLVYIDVSTLATLPKRDFISGMAEVIKYAIIKDRVLFDFLEDNIQNILDRKNKVMNFIVHRCASIKASIVEKDVRETKGVRVILNFGHTIGHAIETASYYSGKYTHGEAVSLGMIVASDISQELGLCKQKTKDRIVKLIESFELPSTISGLNFKKIFLSITQDKKFYNGKNRFVLVRGIGDVVVKEDIPVKLIEKSVLKIGSIK